MDKNPFLENEEEEYVVHKPIKGFKITEAQKKRNFKGLEKVKAALKKAGAIIKDYKERG